MDDQAGSLPRSGSRVDFRSRQKKEKEEERRKDFPNKPRLTIVRIYLLQEEEEEERKNKKQRLSVKITHFVVARYSY